MDDNRPLEPKDFDQRLDEAMRKVQGKFDDITRFFQEPRHLEDIKGSEEKEEIERLTWKKYGKERMKTVSVAIVMCLHLGIEPPDAPPKPDKCSKLISFVDPYEQGPIKQAHQMADNLMKAYKRWQPRARYRLACDPALEDVRKICTTLRRVSGGDRSLFHYNGHGVPKPTPNGEIWVFNKSYTQYIPLSLFDLQSWLEYPAVYVWECNSAETILNSFARFADDHEKNWQKEFDTFQERSELPLSAISSSMDQDEQAEAMGFPQRRPRFKECIHLAACRIDQNLPMVDPYMPADLFTSCLTSPVYTGIMWYLNKTNRRHQFPAKDPWTDIPGDLSERRTVLGELNWIFTAITDTIAFTSFPRDIFQMLFRQDLLLASLFRSFLLAQRIMNDYDVCPVSVPNLVNCARHELWACWDSTLDMVLDYTLEQSFVKKSSGVLSSGREVLLRSSVFPFVKLIDFDYYNSISDSNSNWFFVQQLQAFELWLDYGAVRGKAPLQLPVVLQVLLSQNHRVRALKLLARFLDFGEWAVGYSLSVGIFPYVLRLLQSSTRELRPWLAFIWAKILAVDPTVQVELFKENGDEMTLGTPAPSRNQTSAQQAAAYQQQRLQQQAIQNAHYQSQYHQQQMQNHMHGGVDANVQMAMAQAQAAQIGAMPQQYQKMMQQQMLTQHQHHAPSAHSQKTTGLKPIQTQLRYQYFTNILNDPDVAPRQKIVPAFVIATLFHNGYKVAQENLTEKGYVTLGCTILVDEAQNCRLLKLWLLIGLGRLWSDYNAARWAAVRSVAYERVAAELNDNSPEVRAAAVFAIGGLIKNSSATNEHASFIDIQLAGELIKRCTFDGAIIVREELIVALQWFVFDFEPRFARLLLDLTKQLNIVITVSQNDEEVENEAIDIASTMPSLRIRHDNLDSTDGPAPGYKKRIHSSVFLAAMEETVQSGAVRRDATSSSNKISTVDDKEDQAYKDRATRQIVHLEGKFIEPFHRAWLALLTLSLDPITQVARMAQKIVKRVERQSLRLTDDFAERIHNLNINQMQRQLSNIEMSKELRTQLSHDGRQHRSSESSSVISNSTNGASSQNVQFVVGSPAARSSPMSCNDNSLVPSIQTGSASDGSNKTDNEILSSPAFDIGSPKSDDSGAQTPVFNGNSGLENDLKKEFISQKFTPRRAMTGKGNFTRDADQTSSLRRVINDPLVTTKFIDWCSHVFVEPILDLLQADSKEVQMSDAILTHTSATDWALHAYEGLRQSAESESTAFKNTVNLNPILAKFRLRHEVRALATSKLRKCIYATDGTTMSICRPFDLTRNKVAKSFRICGDNPFTQDTVSELILINEMSREMIMCCSRNGVVRIWDPAFTSYSEEFETNEIYITAAFPLGDQTSVFDRDANCLFDWDQTKGRLMCTGKKSVRIWDAHYEKTVQDVPYGKMRKQPTALSGFVDAQNEVLTVGFKNGVIDCYDLRIPKAKAMQCAHDSRFSEVMHLSTRPERRDDQSDPVPVFFSGHVDGQVCIWDPRMFQEPLYRQHIGTEVIEHMSVHAEKRMFAASCGNKIRVGEFHGPIHSMPSPFAEPATTRKDKMKPVVQTPNVTAIAMQQIRLQTVAAYADNTICVFGPTVKH